MSSLANPGATCFGLRQRARCGRRESRSCLRSPASLSPVAQSAAEQIKELETEDRKRAESFREAWREYELLANVRMDWLAKRIASRDRRHVPYMTVELSVAVLGRLPTALVTDDWTTYDVDEIDQWWRNEAEERTRLQARVTQLAGSITAPCPVGPIERLRRWWDRRKQRRAKKTMSKPASG
jgi:hypothetical protein